MDKSHNEVAGMIDVSQDLTSCDWLGVEERSSPVTSTAVR